MTFERITVDHDVMGGMPCIRGVRVPVATVIAMMADGMTPIEIVDELPDLTVEDVREALRYAERRCANVNCRCSIRPSDDTLAMRTLRMGLR